ncbi:hypothetical protein TrVGV298_000998 [Trichoderma virens]|nr:hypothetical protein TrVGV298_000998 [Trichoderma virens]
MAEAEDRDPIAKLCGDVLKLRYPNGWQVKSATCLHIPKEIFKHLKNPSFLTIVPNDDDDDDDDDEDRVIHFNACEQVEFCWEPEIGPDVPVWARQGDFTVSLPSTYWMKC